MRDYLIRITAAAMLASLIRRLSPSGGAGRAARLGAGLLVLLTALGPFVQMDPLRGVSQLVRESYGDPLASGFDGEANDLLSELISQEAEAYILDKAGEEGLTVAAKVETRVTVRYPVPWRVTVRGTMTQIQREFLSAIIARDLGIPEERQEWWSM